MDHLTPAATNVAAKTIVAHAEQSQNFQLEHAIPFLAILVWFIEYRRRTRPSSDSEFGQRLFRQLLPELAGLTVLSGVVVVLLVCRREEQALLHDEAWRDVKKEWPLLLTADTLIGLQALLRLVFLLSASLRRTGAHVSPLDGEPAAFFMLAALARVVLLALSPRDVYHLDGPLGGDMNVAVEVTAFVLLLPLGFRVLQKGFLRLGNLALIVLVLAASAKHNHFALADSSHSHLDMLFSLVMLLEIVAAVAFYVQSAKVKGSYAWDAFTGFAHFMLPLQQALPVYFLLTAFAPPFKVEPSLVGKGCPFELLQAGGLLQVVMYILAAILYSVACVEEKQVSLFAAQVPAGEAPPADECVICLGSCENCGDVAQSEPHWRRLRCGHHFHERCIFEWLKKAKQCPMCRRDVCEKSSANWRGAASRAVDAGPTVLSGAATEESVPLLDSRDDSSEPEVVRSIVL